MDVSWIACGVIVLSAAAAGHALDWQAAVVRDAEGPCAVVDASAGSLAIAVRAPSSPTAEGLAALPESLRDFASLPTRIVLQSPPDSGTGAPVDRLPTTMEAGVHYPVIDGALSAVPFVRATFPTGAPSRSRGGSGVKGGDVRVWKALEVRV